jgi:raffinose/stachyose/melibiose transport system substrate-binding protein
LRLQKNLFMYVTGEEYSRNLTEKYGLIGSVNVGEVDVSKFSNITQEYVNLFNSGITLTPIYDIHMDSNVIDIMNTGLQELLNGTETPSGLAEKLQAAQEKAEGSK